MPSARKSGNGAAFSITQGAARDELKSSPNGLHANASEPREGSVQPLNCPTQAKRGLEWATRREHMDYEGFGYEESDYEQGEDDF